MLLYLFYAGILVAACQAMSGIVEYESIDAKFVCPSAEQKSYKVASEMQCVQRCLRMYNCGIVNYKIASESSNVEKNCEVFVVNNGKFFKQNGAKGWKAIVFKRERKEYESCSEIYKDKNQRSDRNGLYKLKSGKHFCLMDDVSGCGSGGWTLAMKVNGSKGTFYGDSEYWKNNETFNVENGSRLFDVGEAKFPAFSAVSLKSICFGISFAGKTKWILLSVNSTSLLDIFKNQTTMSTNFGRDKWKSMISGGSLQPHCNREGINVKNEDDELYARIGIVNNGESHCYTPDSFIGVGLSKFPKCVTLGYTTLQPISCGNFAACSRDNGEKASAAMCYILIQ